MQPKSIDMLLKKLAHNTITTLMSAYELFIAQKPAGRMVVSFLQDDVDVGTMTIKAGRVASCATNSKDVREDLLQLAFLTGSDTQKSGANFTREPPEILMYHGTNSTFVPGILAEGLRAPYLASSRLLAGAYGEAAASDDSLGIAPRPVILQLTVPAVSLAADSPALMEPVGYGRFNSKDLDSRVALFFKNNCKASWLESLMLVGSVKSLVDVPASAIEKQFVYEPAELVAPPHYGMLSCREVVPASQGRKGEVGGGI